MFLRDIFSIVSGTGDPAFATDGSGNIVAWNTASEEAFGTASDDACGQPCSQIIAGVDECGTVCSDECVVLQHSNTESTVRNFDLFIETPAGKKWFNASLISIGSSSPNSHYKIHILRQIDLQKRLELSVREFLVNETNVSDQQASTLMSTGKSVSQDIYLTKREIEVLKLTAEGSTSPAVAKKLGISTATVNNHLQHILKKLNAHSRLEAVHKAEHARII